MWPNQSNISTDNFQIKLRASFFDLNQQIDTEKQESFAGNIVRH